MTEPVVCSQGRLATECCLPESWAWFSKDPYRRGEPFVEVRIAERARDESIDPHVLQDEVDEFGWEPHNKGFEGAIDEAVRWIKR